MNFNHNNKMHQIKIKPKEDLIIPRKIKFINNNNKIK